MDYTLKEMMTICAAREIRNGDIVFCGTGISMLAAMAAKNINAPESVIFFETGAIDSALEDLPLAVGDSRVMYHTSCNGGLLEAFGTMQNRFTGTKVVGILGAAQIDIYGNLNSTVIGDYVGPKVRFSGSGGAASVTVTVNPVESTELLANPGMGWQTFYTFADEDPNLDGLPSGSAYIRFSWHHLEPADGVIDVTSITESLARARQAGQSLMIRVMTAGPTDKYTPAWLESAGCKMFEYEYEENGITLTAPDLDDPVCWNRFEQLMNAVGDAVGQEPDLQVDIGGVGLWGEWHFWNTTPEVPLPSHATRQKVVDLHLSLFPNSPKMMLIGDVDTLRYATNIWRICTSNTLTQLAPMMFGNTALWHGRAVASCKNGSTWGSMFGKYLTTPWRCTARLSTIRAAPFPRVINIETKWNDCSESSDTAWCFNPSRTLRQPKQAARFQSR